MDGSYEAEIASSQQERERLAKEWLLRLIERTPLPDVGELPVEWIIAEAPPLIADIFAALADPAPGPGADGEEERRERTRRLLELRAGSGAAEQIPRDLAVLQTLLIETLQRQARERQTGDFARGVERLAEVFGAIQGTITRSLVEGRRVEGTSDELTGLPGPTQLDEWLQILLAERQRYGHDFALTVIEIDGLAAIDKAYGRSAADRIVAAVAGVIGGQVRATDQTFRLQEDEFAILAPHTEVNGVLPMAERIASLVERSQLEDGPRVAVAAGIAGSPGDGETPGELLEAAVAASYAAKASSKPVATSPERAPLRLQDS